VTEPAPVSFTTHLRTKSGRSATSPWAFAIAVLDCARVESASVLPDLFQGHAPDALDLLLFEEIDQ
jgi:hypothetical protein